MLVSLRSPTGLVPAQTDFTQARARVPLSWLTRPCAHTRHTRAQWGDMASPLLYAAAATVDAGRGIVVCGGQTACVAAPVTVHVFCAVPGVPARCYASEQCDRAAATTLRLMHAQACNPHECVRSLHARRRQLVPRSGARHGGGGGGGCG